MRRELLVLAWGDPPNYADQGPLSADERRLLRAAMLYADKLLPVWLGIGLSMAGAVGDPIRITESNRRRYRSSPNELPPVPTDAQWERAKARHVLGKRLMNVSTSVELTEAAERLVEEAASELRPMLASGAIYIPEAPFLDSYDAGPVADLVSSNLRFVRRRSGIEAALAASLLGQLEAFPDASINDLLDVRERLAGPRVLFQAAIADAVAELTIEGTDAQSSAAAISRIQDRVVAPALQVMQQELDALRVRRTLLRLSSDKSAVAAAAASASLALGSPLGNSSLIAALHAALVAPVAASLASEGEFRAGLRAELATRPFWMLHEANRLLGQKF
jgi:hypothetical protein